MTQKLKELYMAIAIDKDGNEYVMSSEDSERAIMIDEEFSTQENMIKGTIKDLSKKERSFDKTFVIRRYSSYETVVTIKNGIEISSSDVK